LHPLDKIPTFEELEVHARHTQADWQKKKRPNLDTVKAFFPFAKRPVRYRQVEPKKRIENTNI
jgi:hypothetical protein